MIDDCVTGGRTQSRGDQINDVVKLGDHRGDDGVQTDHNRYDDGRDYDDSQHDRVAKAQLYHGWHGLGVGLRLRLRRRWWRRRRRHGFGVRRWLQFDYCTV